MILQRGLHFLPSSWSPTLCMCFMLLFVGTSTADPQTVFIKRQRNTTAHCHGTVLSAGVVLSLADCMFNATSKQQWNMLTFNSNQARMLVPHPLWTNTTSPLHNFALAFVSTGRLSDQDTSIYWSSYGVEVLGCSVEGDSCTSKADRTLDLSNGTLIKYSSSKSGLLPGTPIFQHDSKVFGLIQDKCDKGWGTSKSKCGIRLNREVFNFICQETKDSVAGCTDTLLQLGSDESPSLIGTVADYRKLIQIDSSYTILILYCANQLCTTQQCQTCNLCSDKSVSNFDSLDRLISFSKRPIIVKRVDAARVYVDISHVPFIAFRPKSKYQWFEYRESKTKLIKDFQSDDILTNKPYIYQLNTAPEVSDNNRVKRIPDHPSKRRKTCGICIGNDAQDFQTCKATTEKSVFSGAIPITIDTGHDTARHCFKHNGKPIYAVFYDCKLRIPIWSALKVDMADIRKNIRRQNRGFKPVDGIESRIDKTYQASNNDYACSSSREPCMQKGHLIADNYARGSAEYAKLTYFYINSVPQHKYFNHPAWFTDGEQKLMNWAEANCDSNLYIVVGTIPSNIYYGREGTSNRQDDQVYRINVPKYMWTAACCEKNYRDISFAFYGENKQDGFVQTSEGNLQNVKTFFTTYGIIVFPGRLSCNF